MNANEPIADLAPLIAQARRENRWLWCPYQDLWWSPRQLEAANAEGKFRWHPDNFKLRDPIDRLAEADERIRKALEQRKRIEKILADEAGR